MRRPGRPRKTDAPFPRELLVRYCECCGRMYEKPANQPWGRWLRRRFCTRPCPGRKAAAA